MVGPHENVPVLLRSIEQSLCFYHTISLGQNPSVNDALENTIMVGKKSTNFYSKEEYKNMIVIILINHVQIPTVY